MRWENQPPSAHSAPGANVYSAANPVTARKPAHANSAKPTALSARRSVAPAGASSVAIADTGSSSNPSASSR